ncbi:HNH endonuclease [Rhizobium tumorigenes]|uniref:HNH endonuclease signature motif containing protein n=1 Tax=Rhizobium tumorigenes TaxID=2041385 RepID=A0AAF1KR17_9HYPH|nr:HNH endonuclease signature motif containing protein [Rhizobium tumorigenes]WFR95708.1 HNH endonuclease signature motif containing protein [Rhizobium tumorigenes]
MPSPQDVPLEAIPHEYVLRAIENCRTQGRAAFDASYGKYAPTRYPMVHNGEEFTPKSIFRETVKLYESDHGAVLVDRHLQGGFKSHNGVTRVVGRWGFAILDRTTGRRVNPEDFVAEEAVADDDLDKNEAEVLQHALDETEREAAEIDREIAAFGPPEGIKSETTRYRRNMLLRARVLQIANGSCELCKEEASFVTRSGAPYLEVHHVKALSNWGHDELANMAAICPTCHRNIHFGYDGKSLNDQLAEKVAFRLKNVAPSLPGTAATQSGRLSNPPPNSSSIAFAPYIGPRYNNSDIRLILIGESHYADPDEDPVEATRTVVRKWRDRTWAIRFLTVAARVLMGKKAWEIDRETALDDIGFYNFIQFTMPTIDVRPTSEQARDSYEAFREVLAEHDPTHLLVAGSGFLWWNMPKSDRDTAPLVLGGDLFERRDYKTPSGHACAIPIAHLSRASAPEWQLAVAEFKTVRP